MPLFVPRPARTAPLEVVVVGAGPRALSLLERLTAWAGELAPHERLRVHLVDPHPPGSGRIWRNAQSALLRVNSMTADVTLWPDETVPLQGPLRTGPTLQQWVEQVAASEGDDPLVAEARACTARTFPTRRLQGAYLRAVLAAVLADLPPSVEVVVHAATATDVLDDDGRDVVVLDDGSLLPADAVVLAHGHLDVEASPQEQQAARFATGHGLAFVPTGYTADLDLTALRPAQDVLVRGLGLAFVDLMVLLTEGRGGRFIQRDDGELTYLPSGEEPHLLAGSRRGVPYRSKLGYAHPGAPVEPPRHLTPDGVRARTGGDAVRDFGSQVWPLLLKDLARAHHAELAATHPHRTAVPLDELDSALNAYDWADPRLQQLLAAAVHDPRDRFDVEALDRPLATVPAGPLPRLQKVLRAHVRADLERRHDPEYSQDSAVFVALLHAYGALGGLAAEGLLPPQVVAEDVERRWHGFFSYVASGPPGFRLRQLLALSEAGVLTFLGGDLQVHHDPAGVFVARASHLLEEVSARALVEARLPDADAARAQNPLVRGLLARGALSVSVPGPDGRPVPVGKVQARPTDQRLLRADGAVWPGRFAVGPWVSGGAAAAAFPRPRTAARFFVQNDAVAGEVLKAARSAVAERELVRDQLVLEHLTRTAG